MNEKYIRCLRNIALLYFLYINVKILFVSCSYVDLVFENDGYDVVESFQRRLDCDSCRGKAEFILFNLNFSDEYIIIRCSVCILKIPNITERVLDVAQVSFETYKMTFKVHYSNYEKLAIYVAKKICEFLNICQKGANFCYKSKFVHIGTINNKESLHFSCVNFFYKKGKLYEKIHFFSVFLYLEFPSEEEIRNSKISILESPNLVKLYLKNVELYSDSIRYYTNKHININFITSCLGILQAIIPYNVKRHQIFLNLKTEISFFDALITVINRFKLDKGSYISDSIINTSNEYILLYNKDLRGCTVRFLKMIYELFSNIRFVDKKNPKSIFEISVEIFFDKTSRRRNKKFILSSFIEIPAFSANLEAAIHECICEKLYSELARREIDNFSSFEISLEYMFIELQKDLKNVDTIQKQKYSDTNRFPDEINIGKVIIKKKGAILFTENAIKERQYYTIIDGVVFGNKYGEVKDEEIDIALLLYAI